MIISTATKSLCERCNADMKEKLACEIYELIAASGLPFVYIMKTCGNFETNQQTMNQFNQL